jgi:hypothetical protein
MKIVLSDWLMPPNLLVHFLAVRVYAYPSVRRSGYLRWLSMN